jgi:hypothetical protein
MKLNINKYYIVYTTSNYIENLQIKVLGLIGYDRASQYQSMIENISINEKFINTNGDTLEFLKKQIFYDCAVVKNVNGEYQATGEHVILWDDIIDFERTQRLNTEYTYKLTINFSNFEANDNITKEDIIETINNAIAITYNTNVEKVKITTTEIYDDSLDSITTKLADTEKVLEDAKDTLIALNSLQTSAKAINTEFTANDINAKINTIGTKLSTIETNVDKVIAQFK